MRTLEHVLFSFFIGGRKFYAYIFFLLAGENSIRGFPFFPFFCEKNKDLKIGFLKYGNAGKTRRSVLTYIYIIYNIKRKERRKHHRDNYTHPFPSTFFWLKLKSFLRNSFLEKLFYFLKPPLNTAWEHGNLRNSHKLVPIHSGGVCIFIFIFILFFVLPPPRGVCIF
jgi:hypothetical protein